jgi:hypothetical protein
MDRSINRWNIIRWGEDMTRQRVINIIGWILHGVMLSLLLYMCSEFPTPSFSSSDKNMAAFKKPLDAFVESGKRFVSAKELYEGSLFDGEKICISIRNEYHEPGGIAQREELALLFPQHIAAISRVELQDSFPQVIVAVLRSDGELVVATGTPYLSRSPPAYIGIEHVSIKEGGRFVRGSAHRGRRCADFEDAMFIRSYSEINKRYYIALADKRSPLLWPYGGVMGESIATQKIN